MKRKPRIKGKNSSKQKKISKILIISIIIIILAILVLAYIDNNGNKFFQKKEIIEYKLTDGCSLLFNNIIHQIKTKENCDSICKNECETQEQSFVKTEFSENETACNTCTCYCE